MFPTLFYLFILFYEGLFSKSTSDYNAEIVHINQQIANKEYKKALVNARLILKSSIFNNSEMETLVAVLELKTKEANLPIGEAVQLTDNSIENSILKSHYTAKKGNRQKGLAQLQQSIVQNGEVDTLIKAYELYAFYFPQNKLKKESKSTQMITQSPQLNTQEALSLLDLMKKKQKNLIY